MKQLLLIRDRIKVFAGKNEAYLMPLFKFLLTLLLMLRINSKLGFMTKIARTPIALMVALAGSFLPVNLTIVILALIVTAHVYALSLETAIIVLALFMILFVLYFRFASKDAVGTLLMQGAYIFGIPATIPVSMGLVGSPASMVSVGCGVIVHDVLKYISVNSADLAKMGEAGSKLGKFKDIIDALLNNKAMFVTVAAYAIVVLVVYIVRRLPIDYCWFLAIGIGNIVGFFVLLVGNSSMKAGISMGGAFFGLIVSVILNIILQFFCFSLDYNKTEKVQFEDDEYYYYVQAVPKRVSSASETDMPVHKVMAARETERPVKKVMVRVPEASAGMNAKAPVRQRPEQTKAPRSKGILGLSGGRPAGEGRLKAEAAARARRERLEEQQRSNGKHIEPLSDEDLDQ